MHQNRLSTLTLLLLASAIVLALGACKAGSPGLEGSTGATRTGAGSEAPAQTGSEVEGDGGGILSLPELEAVPLAGEKLQVVATTSIIGDVVSRVGGEAIDLTTLIAPGQDPHSFVPSVQELAAVAGADVIFVNGWDLEENLIQTLKTVGEEAPLVSVSAGIVPLEADDQHPGEAPTPGAPSQAAAHRADPHTWFSLGNVQQWVMNIQTALSTLDPANAASYKANAEAYRAELQDLQVYAENRLAEIPQERRVLVTNHDTFGYFARDYGFEILGTVIPASSTLAEPSASDLGDLVTLMEARQICTLFTETTMNDDLARTIAAELEGCDRIQILPIYTGSLGPPGSGAESFTGMFRTNIETIHQGLQ